MDVKNIIDMKTDITQLPTEALPEPIKMRVMWYLRNRDFVESGIFGDFVTNKFTSAPMPATGTLMNDGKWRWRDDLWLYLRDYDVQIPQDFIDDVMKFYDEHTVSPLPYQGRLTIYDNDDELSPHHHCRKGGEYWSGTFEQKMDEKNLFIEVVVMPMRIEFPSLKVFFPILAYVEDNPTGKCDTYYVAESRMYQDGSIEMRDIPDECTAEMQDVLRAYITKQDFPQMIPNFLTRDIRVGMPIVRN